jgi:hypothetical protein
VRVAEVEDRIEVALDEAADVLRLDEAILDCFRRGGICPEGSSP